MATEVLSAVLSAAQQYSPSCVLIAGSLGAAQSLGAHNGEELDLSDC